MYTYTHDKLFKQNMFGMFNLKNIMKKKTMQNEHQETLYEMLIIHL